MVDVFLLAEVAWWMMVMGKRGVSVNLLYTGGILASGYAALHVSGWLANTFVGPASPTLLWLEQHLVNDTQSVIATISLMPPVPASNAVAHSQWIALHIVKTLFFVAITAAVFTLFAVVYKLTDALWDQGSEEFPKQFGSAALFAAASGAYLAVLTVVLAANLSWLQLFTPVSDALSQSLVAHAVGRATHLLQGWILP